MSQRLQIDNPTVLTEKEIEAFNAYVRHGSYTEAGKALGKDKSTVYQLVDNLHRKISECAVANEQIQKMRMDDEFRTLDIGVRLDEDE